MMKRILFGLFAAALFAAAGAASHVYFRATETPAAADREYVTPTVKRGEIKLTVNSTGSVQPVQSVQVGSYISGPVLKVLVNFNDKVSAGQLLAQVDSRLYLAAVAREQAALARCKAELSRIKALWTKAARKEERGKILQSSKAISITDMDLCTAERETLDAQLQITEASIDETEANLTTAKTNLEFTSIKSPVDGFVLERKIDPGQTVASLFQSPALFVIAPELDKRVDIHASVKEDDIIRIREAKERGEPVTFTVNAYPNDVFEGKISQIRLKPSNVRDDVNYTVIVEAPNPDFKLLPGMTTNLSFQIEKRAGVPIIPRSALEFSPLPEQVRLCDRAILESLTRCARHAPDPTDGDRAFSSGGDPAAVPGRNRKYVWVPKGGLLSAVPIEIGIGDKTSVEIVSSRLLPGQEVAVGMQAGSDN
ncbi:MAG: efflux RND transporter periplasmic adaptor subunit [Pirellulales bacterium]|nr:efflux RND transporter periplasmic adaptor subunit [Pirellulales bacterium]